MRSTEQRIRHTVKNSIPWILFAIAIVYGEINSNKSKDRDIVQSGKLKNLKAWMHEITKELENTSVDRWRVHDEQEAWRQFIKANDLILPENFHPFILINEPTEFPEIPD
jgi:hypothetical protein